MYALVDCNNFYVSCERLFRPDMEGRAIVVLSNNDGCVISRSQEAKAMGIKMATPFFQVREAVDRGHLQVFSSNYALYGDISARVMNTLEQLAPSVEVYSIDEAFLDLAGIEDKALIPLGQQLKQQVWQWTGIPVGVGIAPTKTLAKLANYAAKHYPVTQGVVDLNRPGWCRRLLEKTPVTEVWGVGRRLAICLQAEDIHSAADLADADPEQMGKRYSVVLARTILELRGTPCLSLEQEPAPKQQVLCSRTFSHRITALQPLQQAVREYAVRAAEKLRQGQQLAQHISVYIRTNPNATFEPKYSNVAASRLAFATDDSRVLLKQAVALLTQIYRPGYRYMKAGVVLNDLQPAGQCQTDLFAGTAGTVESQRLMQVLDRVNQRYQGGLSFAGQGLEQGWAMQRNYLSPRYTTQWNELKRVR